MSRQLLLVSPDRPGAHRSIAGALAEAADGALITIAPGRYEEALDITRAVTLATESGAGTVRVHSAAGSTVVVDAEAVRLTGLVLSCADAEAPVLDLRRGQSELDGCVIEGAAWTAVLAWNEGVLAARGCRVANPNGAGVVVTSRGGNVIEDTEMTGTGSSAVVVAEQGKLDVRECRLDRPGGNGICVNGQASATVESTRITGSAKPAVAVEQEARAALLRVTVSGSAVADAYLTGRGKPPSPTATSPDRRGSPCTSPTAPRPTCAAARWPERHAAASRSQRAPARASRTARSPAPLWGSTSPVPEPPPVPRDLPSGTPRPLPSRSPTPPPPNSSGSPSPAPMAPVCGHRAARK